MDAPPHPTIGRRTVLAILAVGSAAAAAVTAPFIETRTTTFEKEQKEKPRYRVTPDVEAFYRVNRY